MPPPRTLIGPSLPAPLRVCGFVEGSAARGHGLLSGWLKAASVFAYQITYDGKD